MLRKILEAFKTLSTSVIKIETNISSTRSRSNKKTRLYTARVITLAKQHFIRLQTLSTFSESGPELDIKLDLYSKFWDWD